MAGTESSASRRTPLSRDARGSSRPALWHVPPPARRPGPRHQAVGIHGLRGRTQDLGRSGLRVLIPESTLEPGSWVHVAGWEGESLPSGGAPRALGGEWLSRGVRTECFPHTPPPNPSSPSNLGLRAPRAGKLARWRIPLRQVAGLAARTGVAWKVSEKKTPS